MAAAATPATPALAGPTARVLCRQYRLRRRSARTASICRLFVLISVSRQPRSYRAPCGPARRGPSCSVSSSPLQVKIALYYILIYWRSCATYKFFSVFNSPSPIIARFLFGFFFHFRSVLPDGSRPESV